MKALKQLKAEPEEAIYIGDHPENDIAAAMKIGMKGIWKRNNQFQCRGADYKIEDLGGISSFCRTVV